MIKSIDIKKPCIIIEGSTSFSEFKKMVIKHFKKYGIIYDLNKPLLKIGCNCGKVFIINSKKDYKETVCECGQQILHFK